METTQTVLTPTAEWRRKDDGSWDLIRRSVSHGGTSKDNGGGVGVPLRPEDITGDDNIQVVQGADFVVIRRGGHMVLYETTPVPWQPSIDFQGAGVQVTDDPAAGKTNVLIPGQAQAGLMRWTDNYEPTRNYKVGDVVAYGDWDFVFTGPPFGSGYGFGPYGEGPYGEFATDPTGFGVDPYGGGPYGG